MPMKSSILLVLLVVGLSLQIGFKLFDAAEEGMVSAPVASQSSTTNEHEAILKGGDPTELFEPSAAGGNAITYDCKFGKIVGDTHTQSIDNSVYVAYQEGSSMIIQVSPLLPKFLIQKQNNFVSATEFKPDAETMAKLQGLFTHRDKCLSVDLYLSRIEVPVKSV